MIDQNHKESLAPPLSGRTNANRLAGHGLAAVTSLLIATLAIPGLAAEGTPENPGTLLVPDTPPPTIVLEEGYAWSERVENRHIEVDGSQAETVIDFVHAPIIRFMDVEVYGLPTGLPDSTIYTLDVSGGATFENPVGPNGRAVFWSLPAKPSILFLKDSDGLTISTIEVRETTDGLLCTMALCQSAAGSAGGGSAGGGSVHTDGPSGGGSSPAPTPSSYATSTGSTLNQGAVSTSYYVKVTATGCYSHTVTVSVKVTGGGLAVKGTAGGSYTYTRDRCDTIYSNGPGTRSVRSDTFEKATYSDGSSRVYAKTAGVNVAIQNWYVTPVCTGGGNLCFETVTLMNCQSYSRTVSELGSGTATIGAGFQTPAWSVEGSISLTAAADSKVKWDFTSMDCGTHTYCLGVLAGNKATTGLIGVVKPC